MNNLHVITVVKNSIESALITIDSILTSECTVNFKFYVYNDFSSDETKEKLEIESQKLHFSLINLCDFSSNKSSNLLKIIQLAQQNAIADKAHLLFIDSDIVIGTNTIQRLYENAGIHQKVGMISAITTNIHGKITSPFLFTKDFKTGIFETKKSLHFCCIILTYNLLSSIDFRDIKSEKVNINAAISKTAIGKGFFNYLLTSVQVLYFPHKTSFWSFFNSNSIEQLWQNLTKKHKK